MKVTNVPIYTKYKIGDGDKFIYAKISKESITLNPDYNHGFKEKKFLFQNSEPEVVEAIAQMMLEAVRIQRVIRRYYDGRLNK